MRRLLLLSAGDLEEKCRPSRLVPTGESSFMTEDPSDTLRAASDDEPVTMWS
jgi:hypothetical protein